MSAGERRLGGVCLKVGDHVNTDILIPARYLTSIDPTELAEHAFEPMGPEFQERLRRSQVIVAGRNFGCGSAREQAATCLLGAGVQAVVAASFSRVFFRNAINTGLLVVECSEAVDAVRTAMSYASTSSRGRCTRARGRSRSRPTQTACVALSMRVA